VKKSLMFLLVACFVLGIAGTAMAFPVDMNGDARFQFRNWQDNIAGSKAENADHNDQLARIRLNFSAPVDENVTLYGRLGLRSTFGASSMDPAKDLLDQYGVKVKDSNDWTYNVGRQGVSMGQGSVISTGNDVGYDARFDGLVASGKLGVVDSKFAVGKTTEIALSSGTTPSKNVWGADFSTAVADGLTIGVTGASVKDMAQGSEAAKYLGINASYTPISNLSLNGEYVKSNADTDNKAYFIGGTYSWDKDNFTIQYNNVEANGVDSHLSGISTYVFPFNGDRLGADGNKYTGFTYAYNHQLSKAANFNLCYQSLKTANMDGHDNEYAAGVQWSF
jgi:hypothetical protein